MKTKLEYTIELTRGMMLIISIVAVISIIGTPSEYSFGIIFVRLVLWLALSVPLVFSICYLYVYVKYEELVEGDKELDKKSK
ncbi:hypothetical protein [Pseudoalteromonas xiamenensis]